MKRLAMTEKQYKKVEQLHYGWYVQALTALLGAVGKQLYMKMDRNNRRAFVACLDNIDNENDLQSGAQCLVKAFDGQLVSSFPFALHHPYYGFADVRAANSEDEKKRAFNSVDRRIFAKSLKLKITGKSKLNKKSSDGSSRNVKTGSKRWRSFHKCKRCKTKSSTKLYQKVRPPTAKKMAPRWKRNVLSLYNTEETILEAKRLDRESVTYHPVNMKSMPALLSRDKSVVGVLTDVIGSLWRIAKNQTKADKRTLHSSYSKLQQLQMKLKEANQEGEFKYRMIDVILGKDNPFRKRRSFTERFRDLMPERVVDESVYGLIDAVSKHTGNVNQKFLSPRILPLLPDKYRTSKPLLSPDLFPFYKDDTGNTILPIPEMLEKSGLNHRDRISILELIMDVSGANDAIEKVINLLNNMKQMGLDKDVISITLQIDKVFKNLTTSLETSQRRELAKRQYSFLTKTQMLKLYGVEGILNTTVADLPFDIEEFSSLNSSEREESLRNTIRLLAKDPTILHRRYKRTFELRLFKHATLSPFAFAPSITTLTVLGPVTLSPSLFSPSIFSPQLLSPPVISPQVGNPLIFSPYVLGPNVLSAAVFNAYVFSPYVLSPNVLNPYVLSPLILSPYVLCPDVLSPTVLSGVVLSPSVLSPSIFTQSALALNILSPTFMS